MAYDLDPSEILSYSNQRRQAMANWSQQRSQSDLMAGQADRQYGMDVGNQKHAWDNARTRVPGSFARRGLATSGLYGRGLQEYGFQRNQSFGQLANDYYNKKAQYAQQNSYLDQQYWNSMSNIQDTERMRRAQIAAQLQGLG